MMMTRTTTMMTRRKEKTFKREKNCVGKRYREDAVQDKSESDNDSNPGLQGKEQPSRPL